MIEKEQVFKEDASFVGKNMLWSEKWTPTNNFKGVKNMVSKN